MKDKINIGIMGCASVAKRLVIPNMLSSKKFNVTTIASRSPETAKETAKLFSCNAITGYDRLLEIKEIEAIYIPLPTGLHYEWVLKSLKAGKHVFAEKSISQNIHETIEIIRIANEKKLCVFENFMFPYHSQFEFVKNKIENNAIGEIKLLRSSFGFPQFDLDNNIRYNKNLGGGALLDAGAYTLMAAQLFLGKNQKVISSTLNNEGREVDFQGSIMLKNDNDIVSQLSFGFDNFYQNNIELWGSKGKITIERAFTANPGYQPKVVIETQNTKTEIILPSDNHFEKILNKFYESIMNNYTFQHKQILNQSKLLTQVREKSQL